jgi:hypothetical protein
MRCLFFVEAFPGAAEEEEMSAHPTSRFRLAFSTVFAHLGAEGFELWRKS